MLFELVEPELVESFLELKVVQSGIEHEWGGCIILAESYVKRSDSGKNFRGIATRFEKTKMVFPAEGLGLTRVAKSFKEAHEVSCRFDPFILRKVCLGTVFGFEFLNVEEIDLLPFEAMRVDADLGEGRCFSVNDCEVVISE